MSKGKRPSFQFYPGDWLNDAALRLVSVGARGLWIDMLCMMHQGTPYGHLKVAGKVILAPNLARTLGATLQEVEGWLAELKEVNAYSINDDGCIYSRRMVRDEEIRLKRAEGGTYGGNPALGSPRTHHPKYGRKDNQNPTLDPTLPHPPSSSSSSSFSKEEEGVAFAPPAASPPPPVSERKKPERKPSAVFDASVIPPQLAGDEFSAEWKAWLDYRKEIRKPVTPSSAEALFKVFCSHGVARSIQEMRRARANGWQGVRFDDPPRNGSLSQQAPAPKSTNADEFSLIADSIRAKQAAEREARRSAAT